MPASRLLLAALSAAAAVTTSVIVAAPADAAPSYCDSPHQCLWNNIHYVGPNNSAADIFEINAYAPYFTQFSYPDGITLDRTLSSSYNNGTSTKGKFRFYLSQACGGDYFTISPGTGDSDFTNGSPTVGGRQVNDAARSGAFSSYVGSC